MADDLATLRWECPECPATLHAVAHGEAAARTALEDAVREHLASIHPHDRVSAHVASQWLAAAGHQVELWGGPLDGTTVWLPPGDLPPVIGVAETSTGAVVPIRATAVQAVSGAQVYRCGETAGRARVRYLHDARWAS